MVGTSGERGGVLPLSFRDGTEVDVACVARMLADDRFGVLSERPGDPGYLEGFRRMRAQSGRLISAELNGAVVGCLQFNVIHGVSQRGMSVAQVEGVRVDSARRGAGIGRALMQHALAEAVAAGCGMMQLTSRSDRVEAQDFYAKLGFKLTHVGMKRALP